MKQRNLFNISRENELYQVLLQAYRNLQKGILGLIFRGRQVNGRVNNQGRGFIDVPASLSAKFRIYAPDAQGKSTVMIIIDDLYAVAGERNGKTLYDNPVLWGRIQQVQGGSGETIFFFNDPSGREVMNELKAALDSKGIPWPEELEQAEPKPASRATRPAAVPPPPVRG